MPIRTELRHFYNAEWRRNRLATLDALGWSCSVCGRFHRMLNLAHLTHDPRDASMIAVLCPACHARNDARHAYAVRRRTWAKRAGQLWLMDALEWAPFPSWMIPYRVLKAAQGGLFDDDGS